MRYLMSAVLALALTPLATAQTAPSAPAAPTAAAQPARPPTPPDPAHMTRQQLQAEVTAARPYIQNGGVHGQRPPGCTSAESRQFDFWVGDWDVTNSGGEVLVAESTISMEDQGCDILEFWRPFAGAHGHSINAYDARDHMWHQMWVDASGQITNYAGPFENGVMRLNNNSPPPPGAPANLRRRMNFQALDANTVRQWGERFNEQTQQWVVAWDLTYHRRIGPHG